MKKSNLHQTSRFDISSEATLHFLLIAVLLLSSLNTYYARNQLEMVYMEFRTDNFKH